MTGPLRADTSPKEPPSIDALRAKPYVPRLELGCFGRVKEGLGRVGGGSSEGEPQEAKLKLSLAATYLFAYSFDRGFAATRAPSMSSSSTLLGSLASELMELARDIPLVTTIGLHRNGLGQVRE